MYFPPGVFQAVSEYKGILYWKYIGTISEIPLPTGIINDGTRWHPAIPYKRNDIVHYQGLAYRAKRGTTRVKPDDTGLNIYENVPHGVYNWEQIGTTGTLIVPPQSTEIINNVGTWNSTIPYQKNSILYYNGLVYKSYFENINVKPDETRLDVAFKLPLGFIYWQQIGIAPRPSPRPAPRPSPRPTPRPAPRPAPAPRPVSRPAPRPAPRPVSRLLVGGNNKKKTRKLKKNQRVNLNTNR
jgi:hypothetical protein